MRFSKFRLSTTQARLSANRYRKTGCIDSSTLLDIMLEGIIVAMQILGATYWAGRKPPF